MLQLHTTWSKAELSDWVCKYDQSIMWGIVKRAGKSQSTTQSRFGFGLKGSLKGTTKPWSCNARKPLFSRWNEPCITYKHSAKGRVNPIKDFSAIVVNIISNFSQLQRCEHPNKLAMRRVCKAAITLSGCSQLAISVNLRKRLTLAITRPSDTKWKVSAWQRLLITSGSNQIERQIKRAVIIQFRALIRSRQA